MSVAFRELLVRNTECKSYEYGCIRKALEGPLTLLTLTNGSDINHIRSIFVTDRHYGGRMQSVFPRPRAFVVFFC
jgi:hypothetical protein